MGPASFYRFMRPNNYETIYSNDTHLRAALCYIIYVNVACKRISLLSQAHNIDLPLNQEISEECTLLYIAVSVTLSALRANKTHTLFKGQAIACE